MAAQDAELKLQVSLDLAYFRRQLATLSQQLGGQSIQLNAQINRKEIQKELNLLGRNFKKRNYSIEIRTNLKTELKQARELVQTLQDIATSNAAIKGVAAKSGPSGITGFTIQQASYRDLQALYKLARQAKLPLEELEKGAGSKAEELRRVLVPAFQNIGEDAKAGLVKGLADADSKLAEIAKGMSNALLAELKTSLGIASPSIKMRRLGDFAAEGFEIGLTKGLDEARDSAVAKMRELLNALRGEASKFGPALMMAMGGGGTEGLREALLMASGMGGLFTPETYGQKMKRGGRGPVAGIFGAGNAGAGFAGLPKYSMSAPVGMLPAAGQTGLSLAQAARVQQAYARSAARGASVMAQGGGFGGGGGSLPPGIGGGALVPGGGGGGSNFNRGYRGLRESLRELDKTFGQKSLPLAGAINELGREFGYAVKQVLLFGTAYKALAFLTDLPAQALEASRSLQSFNNQLLAITGSTSAASRSMEFIDSTVARFNIPLESARQGFVRLYASMEPAGMEPDTIENLFVGISKASATLGLSADQVDRVNYAFSQMASKGKVMSEEVTGQLGDVIPGALSLMSDAAGLSMGEFKKAMEDGLVSGAALEQLFKNLPIVMEERFGKGAAGAAKTLQGQLNNLSTETKRLYEAFDPLVQDIAAKALPLISQGLSDAQDAIKAFGLKVEGVNPATGLLSDNAKTLYDVMVTLGDATKTVMGVMKDFQTTFEFVGGAVLNTVRAFNVLIGNPIGSFFVRLATYIALATAALNAFVVSGIFGSIKALIANAVQIGFNIKALKTLIMTSRAAKIALGGIVAGGIIVGLEMLVTHISNAADKTNKLKEAALLTADALRQMSFDQLLAEKRGQESVLRAAQQLKEGYRGTSAPTAEQERLAGVAGLGVSNRAGQRRIDMSMIGSVEQQTQRRLAEIRHAMKNFGGGAGGGAAAAITPLTLGAGDGDGTGGKLNEYIQDQAKLLQLNRDIELQQNQLKVNLGQVTEAQGKQIAMQISKKYELLAVENAYDTAVKKMETEKMSAADKVLKLRDLQLEKSRENALIELKYSNDQLESTKNLRDAIEALKEKKSEQEMLNKALAQGHAELTPAMQAELDVMKLTKNMTADQVELNRDLIDTYRQLAESIHANADANQHLQDVGAAKREQASIGKGLMAGFFGSAASKYEGALADGKTEGEAQELAQIEEKSMRLRTVFDGIQSSIQGVSSAFGTLMTEGIASMIDGTATAQEVFSNFLKTVGQILMQEGAKMIAVYTAIGIARIFAGFSSGKTNSSDAIPSTGEPGGLNIDGVDQGMNALVAANGAVWKGGFQAFANGGVVNGPTLGLVGEGKYNEAIVPLPDGKSIPVQMKGESIGDKMKGSQAASGPPILNMSFQTTKFGNTEYVSKDQLEQAMMMTQQLASKQGASKGAAMAIDKLIQSPSTRKKVGLG